MGRKDHLSALNALRSEIPGLTIEMRRNSHLKITVPGREGVVFASYTPSDHQATANAVRDVRRVFGAQPKRKARRRSSPKPKQSQERPWWELPRGARW